MKNPLVLPLIFDMEPSESHATRIRSDRVRFRSFGSVWGPFSVRWSFLGPFGSVLGPSWVHCWSVSALSGLSGSEKSIGFTIRFGHGAV